MGELSEDTEEPPKEEQKEQQKHTKATLADVWEDKSKCWFCGKKSWPWCWQLHMHVRVGLLGFECRCGYTFCGKHRHAEVFTSCAQ